MLYEKVKVASVVARHWKTR